MVYPHPPPVSPNAQNACMHPSKPPTARNKKNATYIILI